MFALNIVYSKQAYNIHLFDLKHVHRYNCKTNAVFKNPVTLQIAVRLMTSLRRLK
jgi:hypothetical protein